MIFIGVYQKAVRSKWWQCQQYGVPSELFSLMYIKETSTVYGTVTERLINLYVSTLCFVSVIYLKY